MVVLSVDAVPRIDELEKDLNTLWKDSIHLEEKIDPETAPYESKYQARTELQELLSKTLVLWMEVSQSSTSTVENKDRVKFILNCIYTRIGSICNFVEEPHEADRYLQMALEWFLPGVDQFLKNNALVKASEGNQEESVSIDSIDTLVEELSSNVSFEMNGAASSPMVVQSKKDDGDDKLFTQEQIALELLNQLGILWSNREQPLRALCYLEAARRIFTDDGSGVSKLHTLSLFYLAQVYGNLQHVRLSSYYCHETLRQQALTANNDDFTSLEWARNALQLGSYYVAQLEFQEAAHCYAACDEMLQRSDSTESEALSHQVEISWGQLYLSALQVAKKISMMKLEGIQILDNDLPNMKIQKRFEGFSTLPERVEHLDVAKIKVFDDARDVFKIALQYFVKAKDYFVLDGYVSDHLKICQAISTLYNLLAFFETDLKRQLAMHQRRTLDLEPYVDQLNASIYTGKVKEFAYELGEIYNVMADLKEKLIISKGVTGSKVSDYLKYNSYAERSIKFFDTFLKMYYTNNMLPSVIDLDELGIFLRATFFQARLYSRMQSTDKAVTISNYEKSIELYKKTIEMEERYGGGKNKIEWNGQFDEELKMCREMVLLLPKKMDMVKLS